MVAARIHIPWLGEAEVTELDPGGAVLIQQDVVQLEVASGASVRSRDQNNCWVVGYESGEEGCASGEGGRGGEQKGCA